MSGSPSSSPGAATPASLVAVTFAVERGHTIPRWSSDGGHLAWQCAGNLVEQAAGLPVAERPIRVRPQVTVVGKPGEPVTVSGMGEQSLDVGVVAGGGVEPLDHAVAQVEVFGERRPAGREVRLIEVAEDPDSRAHRKEQAVAGLLRFLDVDPAPVCQHEPSAIVRAVQYSPPPVRHRRNLFTQADQPRVLQVIAAGSGQAVAHVMVGGKGLERGMAHPGLRRVREEQLVVPRLKAPVGESAHEAAQGVLHAVPDGVDDVGVDAGGTAWRTPCAASWADSPTGAFSRGTTSCSSRTRRRPGCAIPRSRPLPPTITWATAWPLPAAMTCSTRGWSAWVNRFRRCRTGGGEYCTARTIADGSC